MVRRQHERLFETTREHRERNKGSSTVVNAPSRPLPFSQCALSLTAYTKPVTTEHSQLLFDQSHLLPFVLKHKVDPVTGTAMTIQEIVALRMDRDAEGHWQCPVTTKPFHDGAKIVAILQRNGNEPASVYSYAAYHQFNVRAKQYEDLVTGKQFDPAKDVICVFDPERRADIQTFHHIRNARRRQQQNTTGSSTNVKHTLATSRIMEKIQKRQAEQTSSVAKLLGKPIPHAADTAATVVSDKVAYFRKSDGSRLHILSSDVTGVVYTDATASTSLMSTAVSSSNRNSDSQTNSNTGERPATAAEISTALYRVVRRQKRKGYVQLHLRHSSGNSIPPLLVELHCDVVPMTCTNFLGLCRDERYNGTTFHRLITDFCIQGGKPKDPTEEETTYWGTTTAAVGQPPMRDEFDDRLRHNGPGILSMANAGPHTNKCQFFITFKSCPHLDRKHSIFGQIVNDNKAEILQQLQAIPTDKKDRPLEPVVLKRVEILQDPIVDARERERERLEAIIDQREGRATTASKNGTGKDSETEEAAAVGKYLKLPPMQKSVATTSTSKQDNATATAVGSRPAAPAGPPPKKKKKFGNFSKW